MPDPTSTFVYLLLEDGGYVLQEDADLSGDGGDGRIILAEIPLFAKACEGDFLIDPVLVGVGAALCGATFFPIDPAIRGQRTRPTVRESQPPFSPPPASAPRVAPAVKACGVALPIDPGTTGRI
jgi:hypothetical protein